MADTFVKLGTDVLPSSFKPGRVKALLNAVNAVRDDVADRFGAAIESRCAKLCEDDALDAVGGTMGIVRAPGESHASYRNWLSAAWDLHVVRGTELGLVAELWRLGFPGSSHHCYLDLIADGAPAGSFGGVETFFFCILRGANLTRDEWAGGPAWKDSPPRKWGLGAPGSLAAEKISRAVQAVHELASGHTSCRFLVVELNPAQPVLPAVLEWREVGSPSAAELRGAHTDSYGAVWFGGAAGTVYAWISGRWVQHTLPTSADIRGVWTYDVNANTQVRYVVGTGGAIFASSKVLGIETEWVQIPSGTTEDLNAIWGTGLSDIWACGTTGKIVHYDGTAWSTVVSGVTETLNAVRGQNATSVLFAGNNGKLRYWDGTTISVVATGVANDLYGIACTSDNKVWVCGSVGYLTTWTIVAGTFTSGPDAVTSGTFEDIRSIWARTSSDIWMGVDLGEILHWDGTSVSSTASPTSDDLFCVTGVSANDVWVGGENGTVLRYTYDLGGGPRLVIPMREQWERGEKGGYASFYNKTYTRR